MICVCLLLIYIVLVKFNMCIILICDLLINAYVLHFSKLVNRQVDKLKFYVDHLGSFLFHCMVHKMNIGNIKNMFDGVVQFEVVTTNYTVKELECYFLVNMVSGVLLYIP